MLMMRVKYLLLFVLISPTPQTSSSVLTFHYLDREKLRFCVQEDVLFYKMNCSKLCDGK